MLNSANNVLRRTFLRHAQTRAFYNFIPPAYLNCPSGLACEESDEGLHQRVVADIRKELDLLKDREKFNQANQVEIKIQVLRTSALKPGPSSPRVVSSSQAHSRPL